MKPVASTDENLGILNPYRTALGRTLELQLEYQLILCPKLSECRWLHEANVSSKRHCERREAIPSGRLFKAQRLLRRFTPPNDTGIRIVHFRRVQINVPLRKCKGYSNLTRSPRNNRKTLMTSPLWLSGEYSEGCPEKKLKFLPDACRKVPG